MKSRRDFLKLLGMAAGASLSGCGSGSDSTFSGSGSSGSTGVTPPTPLAYQYVKLIKSGDPLPGGGRLAAKTIRYSLQSNGDNPPPFMGGVMLTDSRHIYFHAVSEDQTRGIYRIDVDAKGGRSDVKKVVREGDTLPDGTLVTDFSDGDVNNGDDFVLGISNGEDVPLICCSSGGGEFRTLVRAGSTVGGVRLAEDVDQGQSIADDGNVLFVAEYLDDEGDCQGEGLFFMPVNQPDQARLLLSKGDIVPGTRAAINCFGQTDLAPGGRFLVQGSATPEGSGVDVAATPRTFLLRGTAQGQRNLLVAAPELGGRVPSIQTGNVFVCPRLSREAPTSRLALERSAFVVNVNSELAELYVDLEMVLRAETRGRATRSPKGGLIVTVLPPVFGPHGLVYFQVFTTIGMELVVYDGYTLNTVLSKGDVVDGKKVETIIFGALPHCVNANGDFACVVEFEDGETDVYLGIPV